MLLSDPDGLPQFWRGMPGKGEAKQATRQKMTLTNIACYDANVSEAILFEIC